MDEQGRSNHDLSADGIPAGGHTIAHYPVADRHRLFLYNQRLRRRNMEFRDIPIDAGQKNAQGLTLEQVRSKSVEAFYMGSSIAKWEGDTLVIDSTNFVDTTWFGRGGLFHSADMHMVEKFTRKGDEILYQATIEDPDVLIEPWVMPDKILRVRAGAPQVIHERAFCEVYEQGNVSTQLRH